MAKHSELEEYASWPELPPLLLDLLDLPLIEEVVRREIDFWHEA